MKFLGPLNLMELYQIMVTLWVFTTCGKGMRGRFGRTYCLLLQDDNLL